MQFQFRALLSLEERIARIEAATGISTGYARTGRLTPLATARARAGAERDVAAAPDTWGDAASYRILENLPPEAEGRLSPDMAAYGVVRDSISARVWPQAYVAALAQAQGDAILSETPIVDLDAAGARVRTDSGWQEAGHVVIAAGPGTWALLAPHAPALGAGQPVKGQAAVLACDLSALPVIYTDGLYVIPHGKDRVAVGSTSEKRFEDGTATDTLLEDLLARARRVVPALARAPVTQRWAGLRPKPPGREPVVGPIPDAPRTWVAGGGYKISFGIAHAVGDAVAAGLAGTDTPNPLPATFDPGADL